MKILSPFSFLSICGILFAGYILMGCENRVECQSPPSQITFQIIHGMLTYPADLVTLVRVKVSYQENSQQKFVGDLTRMGDVFLSSMLIEDSRRANDPEFSLELDGQVLAKIKLETHTNTAK